MQPMNYILPATQDSGNAFQQGFNNTAGMMATVADYQKAQAMQTLAQQKAEVEAQKRADFLDAANNPSPEKSMRLMTLYPELSEGINRSYSAMSEEEKRNSRELAFSVSHAIQAGNVDAASGLIDRQIEAAKTSGNQQKQKQLEMLKNSVAANPNASLSQLYGILYATDPNSYGALMKNLSEAKTADATRPYEIQSAQGKAAKDMAEGQYAGEKARTDIANTRSQIDDRKFDQRIKAMEAELKRTDSEVKRQELQIKIDEARAKKEEATRTKDAEADSAISAVRTTKMLLSDVLGDEENLRAATGALAFRGSIPGTDARAMAGKLEQLQNALAAENLDRLKGAMSDKDIMFIKNISANLDRYQDEDKLIAELKRVQKVLDDAEARTLKKYGKDGAQQAQPAQAADPLQRLMQKYVK